MWAGRIIRASALAVGGAGIPAVAHVAEVGDGAALVEVRHVTVLGEHVANAIVAVIDFASTAAWGTRVVVLDAGESIELVIREVLRIAPRVGAGEAGRWALVIDRFEIRNTIEGVGEFDQVRPGRRRGRDD